MSKPAATLQAAANPRLHGWTLGFASQGEEHQGALVPSGSTATLASWSCSTAATLRWLRRSLRRAPRSAPRKATR
jgi:hypothetical protein